LNDILNLRDCIKTRCKVVGVNPLTSEPSRID
jgi:hypothetical protein